MPKQKGIKNSEPMLLHLATNPTDSRFCSGRRNNIPPAAAVPPSRAAPAKSSRPSPASTHRGAFMRALNAVLTSNSHCWKMQVALLSIPVRASAPGSQPPRLPHPCCDLPAAPRCAGHSKCGTAPHSCGRDQAGWLREGAGEEPAVRRGCAAEGEQGSGQRCWPCTAAPCAQAKRHGAPKPSSTCTAPWLLLRVSQAASPSSVPGYPPNPAHSLR